MLGTILGVGLIGLCFVMVFKEIKPSYAVMISLVTSLLIIGYVIIVVTDVFTKISAYIMALGISRDLFNYLLKVIGISFLVEFIASIAEEAGAATIAGKISLAGRVLVAAISLPVLFEILDMIMELV